MPPKGKGGKKEVVAQVKLQIPAGQATPAPPVGPALGQHGVNIMDFCRKFIYKDRSFTFELKTPPASVLLKRAAGIAKGSGEPNKVKVGKVTKSQIKEIAELKMRDLNANTIEAAMRIIEGTARSMGIEVVEG